MTLCHRRAGRHLQEPGEGRVIPGEFIGGTTTNRYFLMEELSPGAPLAARADETRAVRWVTQDEARGLIEKTTNTLGKKRDLAGLAAAYAAWQERRPTAAD